jgi:hypothetical protein
MRKPTQIEIMDRDRAIEIMWYMDSVYDTHKTLSFDMVRDKVTYKEWQVTHMYFIGTYRADIIIENLTNTKPIC